jgi:prevent-host-death family protein
MRSRGAAQYNVAEAKARFAELVRRAMAGEEVVIAKDHKPVLRMVPIASPSKSRQPGSAKGTVWMAPDFDDTPPEFEPYTR